MGTMKALAIVTLSALQLRKVFPSCCVGEKPPQVSVPIATSPETKRAPLRAPFSVPSTCYTTLGGPDIILHSLMLLLGLPPLEQKPCRSWDSSERRDQPWIDCLGGWRRQPKPWNVSSLGELGATVWLVEGRRPGDSAHLEASFAYHST